MCMYAWRACMNNVHVCMTCMYAWCAYMHDVHVWMTCMYAWCACMHAVEMYMHAWYTRMHDSHVCMHIHTRTYTCTNVTHQVYRSCVHINKNIVYIYTHTHTHTHTHTSIFTYTWTVYLHDFILNCNITAAHKCANNIHDIWVHTILLRAAFFTLVRASLSIDIKIHIHMQKHVNTHKY